MHLKTFDKYLIISKK